MFYNIFQIVRLEECKIGKVQNWKSVSFQDLYLKLNRIYNFLIFNSSGYILCGSSCCWLVGVGYHEMVRASPVSLVTTVSRAASHCNELRTSGQNRQPPGHSQHQRVECGVEPSLTTGASQSGQTGPRGGFGTVHQAKTIGKGKAKAPGNKLTQGSPLRWWLPIVQ